MKVKPWVQYAIDVTEGKIVTGEWVRLACADYLRYINSNEYELKDKVVERAIKFIGLLKHYKGKHSNQNFQLSNWQQWVISAIVGVYHRGTNKRKHSSVYLEISRKNGKALDITTPIPTPNGWTTMGELKVGDYVYGADGKPTKVTFATDIMYNHDCYTVTFEDGEKVIADADHNWFVKGWWRKKTGVVTTKELVDYKHERNDGKGVEYKWRVPMNKAVEKPTADLPIDPYILGLWLGDGSSREGKFHIGGDDLILADAIEEKCGRVSIRREGKENCYCVRPFKNEKFYLHNELKKLNLFNNKHIPDLYLNSSIDQRLELLRGLMDTDGYVDKHGECEFSQKNELLTAQFCELLSSLGIKNTLKKRWATCDGKKFESCRVQFFTDKTAPCFKLRRKYDRLKDNLNKRMEWKSIIKVEKTESVPVRCITVDNPDHLYLFGEKFTTTHNTAMCAALGLYFLIADGMDGAEVACVANSREQARIAFDFCEVWAKQLDPKNKSLKAMRDRILLKDNHSKLVVCSSADDKLDGAYYSAAIIDEFHAAKSNKLRDVIKSSMVRENSVLITITSAGFDKTGPCYKLRTTCTEILQGVKKDDSVFAAIYSLDDDDDWTDEKVWVKSTPNLNCTVTTEYIKSQVQSALNNPAEEVGVRTKTLNEWLSSSAVWIPDREINAVTAKVDINDFKDCECYIGVDLAAVSDMTAVSYLLKREDDPKLYFYTDYYLPESALVESPNRDLYAHWHRTGELKITSGNVTDYDYITNDMLKVGETVLIRKIAYDSFNSTQWAITSTNLGLPLEPYSQSIGSFNKPTREFERLVRSRMCVIDNNEITRWMFRNVAMKIDHNGNQKPNKGAGKDKKIDGVIAMIEALGVRLDTPQFSGEIFSV